MSELASILAAARLAWAKGETPVLATVVATRGSSYRKRGARMLVTAEGWQAGSISGGCLEADVVRRAAWLVEQGGPVLKTYDTSVDGEVALGCGGEVDVQLEPLREDGELARALKDVVERRVAVEVNGFRLVPSPRLVICGAGHDAIPLAQMATTLGWDVHVVDWRPAQVAAARFPGATVHLLASDALDRLPLEPGCAVIVMSHHLIYDGRVLEAVLRSEAPRYIGVLGPRQRTADLLANRPQDERVHAPVGLALGGEGPAAVALAILSEVHAVLHGASGAPLTQR